MTAIDTTWTVDDLDDELDPLDAPMLPKDAEPVQQLSGPVGDMPNPLPSQLKVLLDEASQPGRRSHQHFRLVAVAVELGLSDAQVVAVATRHTPTVDKYDDRSMAQTLASIAKKRHEHRHVGQTCVQAGCPNAPRWMRERSGTETDTTKGAAVPVLEFLSASELAAEVDAAPPVGWLCAPVWPADAYGMLAAEQKAGKTWAIIDLIIAVAAGRSWLGVYPVQRQGRVVVFLGEGGKRKMLRRLRAVCAFYGVRFEDLPIELCFRAPRLTSELHMDAIVTKLASHDDVVLVIVDPLYLAAQGATGSALYEMGAHLERIQVVAQAAGAALVVVHHWNQTGKGGGAARMSGAGPAEWGRVLVSVAVKNKTTDKATGTTSATLDWSFVGDEIPDTDLRIRRRVWADDPDDLASPMHYEIEQLELGSEGRDASDGLADEKPAVRRVYAVLATATDTLTVAVLGDILARDSTGIPLKSRTIQDSLSRLRDLGKAAAEPISGSNAYGWRVTHAQPTTTETEDAV